MKWGTTDMDFLNNCCIFVDESAFNINMRPPGGWSLKGTPAIVETPSTMTAPHTILGAISAKFVVSMELRKPQENWAKRTKIDVKVAKEERQWVNSPKKPIRKGT